MQPLKSQKAPKGQTHPGESLRLMTEAHVKLDVCLNFFLKSGELR